jgi:hypothetical protein
MAHIRVRRSVAVAGTLSVVGLIVAVGLVRASLPMTRGGDPWLEPGIAAPSVDSVVVVELFTSEGCSSCPPADEVLSRLIRESLDGTVVLGLGEHVDYWDRLGWRDPFSSPAFSNRQSEYQGQVFRTGSIYTPQLVVDGQFEAVGSDVSAVRRAIAKAAGIPKAGIEMALWPADAGHLGVHVQVHVPPAISVREALDMVVALTQDRLTNDVRRGENRGRSLAHDAVVRSLTALGSLNPPVRMFETTATVPVGPDWNPGDIRMIGLLQERRSRRIVGAGSARVRARRSAVSGLNIRLIPFKEIT